MTTRERSYGEILNNSYLENAFIIITAQSPFECTIIDNNKLHTDKMLKFNLNRYESKL